MFAIVSLWGVVSIVGQCPTTTPCAPHHTIRSLARWDGAPLSPTQPRGMMPPTQRSHRRALSMFPFTCLIQITTSSIR